MTEVAEVNLCLCVCVCVIRRLQKNELYHLGVTGLDIGNTFSPHNLHVQYTVELEVVETSRSSQFVFFCEEMPNVLVFSDARTPRRARDTSNGKKVLRDITNVYPVERNRQRSPGRAERNVAVEVLNVTVDPRVEVAVRPAP